VLTKARMQAKFNSHFSIPFLQENSPDSSVSTVIRPRPDDRKTVVQIHARAWKISLPQSIQIDSGSYPLSRQPPPAVKLPELTITNYPQHVQRLRKRAASSPLLPMSLQHVA
jgi:hypothetical protein